MKNNYTSKRTSDAVNYKYLYKPDKHSIAFEVMLVSDYGIVTKERKTHSSVNSKYIEEFASEIITKHTIDNITYTIKSRSSENATQTLKDKLEACIARDIAKIT